MARIDTPIHSDDEFDLLYDAESVSDITDLQDDRGRQAAPTSRTYHTSQERLSGPHEVPVLPHPSREDNVAAVTQQLSSQNLDEDARPLGSLQRGSSSTKSKSNLMNGGLQYTKSVYNKLWSKDALIAVMG